MIRTLSIDEISIQAVIGSAKRGDEIVLEENGEAFAKIIPFDKNLDDEFRAWEAASNEDFFSLEMELAEKI